FRSGRWSRTTRSSWTRSSGPSRPLPRAATSRASPSPPRWAPASRSTPAPLATWSPPPRTRPVTAGEGPRTAWELGWWAPVPPAVEPDELVDPAVHGALLSAVADGAPLDRLGGHPRGGVDG